MTITKGFPSSNTIGSSIRVAEKDVSFLASQQSAHRAGLVGFASKGPINIPTLVTSSRQLHTIFGQPHPDVGDPYLLYAADQYLTVGTELFIVRVGDLTPTDNEAAITASVDVLTAGGAVQIIGNVKAGSGWSFSNDTFFRWRLNGVLASKILVVLANSNRPTPNTGVAYVAQDLVDALNDQLVPSIDGIQFFLSGTGSNALLGVQSTFSYGTSASIELVSVTNSLYGPTSVVGMGTAMTAGVTTGSLTQYPPTSVPTPGTYNFSSFSAGSLNLQVVIDGTDNVLIDNVVQTVTLNSTNQSIATIVSAINTQISNGTIPGGFVASNSTNSLRLTSLHVGRDAKLLVKSNSTADALFGFNNLTAAGASTTCVTAPAATYSCGIVTGSSNSAGTICFTIQAESPGIDGNQTQVIITSSIAEGSFALDVYNYGSQVETWAGLVKDQTSNLYVETYISQNSNYIRIVDNTAVSALPADASITAPVQLSGGTDGIPSDPDVQDDFLVGNTAAMTGLQALSDPEQIDIDLIAIPGHTSTSVVQALIDFCQSSRGDCFAVLDTPFGLSATEVVQWQNGVHPLNDARFDSDFGSIYWPWLKIRDTFNQVDVWTPPSGAVMAAFARSDQIAGPWFAPAGLDRGIVFNVLNVFSRPSLSERDSMYGYRNAVNPIMQFPDISGFVIFGQKTLQRAPSALDRVNVRRMMIFVEKQIKSLCRNLLFEPNDVKLRTQFVGIATSVLETVKNSRGVFAYQVQCDADLNPNDVVDRNELRARIGIQPTRASEFIFIEFAVFRTGSFSESATF